MDVKVGSQTKPDNLIHNANVLCARVTRAVTLKKLKPESAGSLADADVTGGTQQVDGSRASTEGWPMMISREVDGRTTAFAGFFS